MLSIPLSVFQVDKNGNGGIIVDFSTAVIRLQINAYNALHDTFVKYTWSLPSGGQFTLFDTCYDLSSMKSVSVPKVAFHFSVGMKFLPDIGEFGMKLLSNVSHERREKLNLTRLFKI
ncbi:hypothetical protein FXO37_28903 [Capsicum annuum]|nr:hypothetical protein FXO37_28903 [Capsicum annuum]